MIAPEPVGHALGHLAVNLLCHGVRVAGGERSRALMGETQSFGGDQRLLELAIAPKWHIAVPIIDSPEVEAVIEHTSGGDLITLHDRAWPVTVVGRPRFLDEQSPSGTPRIELGATHSNFLPLHPISLRAHDAERELMISAGGEERPLLYDDVLDLVRAALKAAEIDCISLRWKSRLTAGEVDHCLAPLLQAIRRNFDIVVAVECTAPREVTAVDLLYAIGVDAVCFPVEAIDASLDESKRTMPFGETLEALTRAAAVFPRGTVLSSLRIGLESPQGTLESIAQLAQMGVRPVFDLDLIRREWPRLKESWSEAGLCKLWEHLDDHIERAKLVRPWTPHPHAQATMIPRRAFSTDRADDLVETGFWGSRAGQSLVRNLIRLRRRLRVKRVEQSLESSEL